MAIDKFSFYSQNYFDITQLMKLNTEVQEQFPITLGSIVEDAFKDAFLNKFAGVPKWEYKNQASSEDAFCFWDLTYCPGGAYGPYFAIYPLSQAAEIIDASDKTRIKALVRCEVWFDHPEKKRRPITQKNLSAAASKDRTRLEKAGLIVSQDMKDDPYVWLSVGDLLHISAFRDRQHNVNTLVKRIEKFVIAFMPVLERAARM